MSKQILFNKEARDALARGVDKVAQAVRVTLGPRGRNGVLDRGFGAPTITNDGVSIAKEISLKDKFENMGAEFTKEVATKTNDNAGDGTTTAVVLMQAIVSEGMRAMDKGMNPVGIRLGVEAAGRAAVDALRDMSKQIKSKEEIKQVATISAESEELGAIIADAIEKVGENGVVTVEESQSFEVESEVVKGLEFDKGYVSPYMITNPERMEAEYKDAMILITDKKVASIQEILPLLEKLAQTGKKDLVILAEDVEGEALATFVVNKLRGTFNVLAIKAPGYGDRKKEMLEDIATVVGAQVISEDKGMKLDGAELTMLGRARRVVSTKEKTTVVGGKGVKAEIEARVGQIKTQLDQTDSKFDREKLEERLAKLAGGVAVIKVGAATETAMKYLKDKVEDSVNATRAAIEEGIVPGGGTALMRASAVVSGKKLTPTIKNFDEEFQAGVNIVLKALEAPLSQIVENVGRDDVGDILDQVENGKDNAGYNAVADDIEPNMITAGIIDPVKVTRSGVQNATSAAGTLLTSEVAITDEPEEKKDGGMPGGGMPDMGGMGGMM